MAPESGERRKYPETVPGEVCLALCVVPCIVPFAVPTSPKMSGLIRSLLCRRHCAGAVVGLVSVVPAR